VNTGFRAPTPGQVNTLNVTTSASQTGELILNGTYPVDNLVAVTLGSKPLKPETSSSFTAGLVWTMGPRASATLDYYHIDVKDRLVIRNHLVSAADAVLLGAAGVANADLLIGSSANYFINGFDSKIEGIDLAITARMDVGGGELVLDLRHNHNEQTVSNVQPSTINASNVFDLEHQVPHENTVLSADFTRGAFGAVVRINNYGNWRTSAGQLGPGDGTDQYSYNGKALVDLEARYTFGKHYLLAAGAENAFDVKPGLEQDPTAAFLGNKYALTSPFGVNGAFWYGRVGFSY
jgi:iron complex outermembrane receptor protein